MLGGLALSAASVMMMRGMLYNLMQSAAAAEAAAYLSLFDNFIIWCAQVRLR